MIFLNSDDTCWHGFHSVKLFSPKEVNYAGKEKDSQKDNKESYKKGKEDLCLRPLRHGGNGLQGGNGCYPFDVLWWGNEAEEAKEKVLNRLLRFFSLSQKGFPKGESDKKDSPRFILSKTTLDPF